MHITDENTEYSQCNFDSSTTEGPMQSGHNGRTTQVDGSNIRPIANYCLRDDEIDSAEALHLIEQELELDGRPDLNLASFVTTHIDETALKLATMNITKNMSDSDEYPSLMTIHQRCVAILARLWHAPSNAAAFGTSTTGSSEAIHLGGLAMKRRWEDVQKQNGRDIVGVTPNIIMGANSQIALKKFAHYFDVEPRILPIYSETDFGFDLEDLKKNIDENTIGIFVILGSTLTGHYQDLEAINEVLDQFELQTGVDIPIHIDGASGALIAPFCTPNLVWDFRIPRVKSINASGHKFGLTTAGCGWIMWRDKEFLPKRLVFDLNYLGGAQETFTLTFSRPGFPVLHQYYNFLQLGNKGFARVHGQSLANARLMSSQLESTGYFEVLSGIHRKQGVRTHYREKMEALQGDDHEYFNPGLPVVAFRFSETFRKRYPMIPQQTLSAMLRVKGFIVPNYRLPEHEQDIEVLRVVVRNSVTAELIDRLMAALIQSVQRLMSSIDHFEGADTLNEKLFNAILKITESSGELVFTDIANTNEHRLASASSETGNCSNSANGLREILAIKSPVVHPNFMPHA